MSNTYGYIRVSTRERNEDRLLIALRSAAVPEQNIFMDKQSGKDHLRRAVLGILPEIFCKILTFSRVGAILIFS